MEVSLEEKGTGTVRHKHVTSVGRKHSHARSVKTKTVSSTSRSLFHVSTIGKVLSPVTPSGINRKDLSRAVKVVVAEMVKQS